MECSKKNLFLLVIIALLITLLPEGHLLAQRRGSRQKPPVPRRDSVRTALPDEQSFVSLEPLTYWHSGYHVDCYGTLEGSNGPLRTHFFSSSFAARSGLALSTRHWWRTGYGWIGLHSGMEWSMSTGRIYLEVPEYGVSLPEIEAELSLFDFWIGGIYVLPLRLRIPLRTFVTLDGGWLQLSLSLRSEGEKVGSYSDGLKISRFLGRYGVGVEFPLVRRVSALLKYQRYILSHSQFEPQKGLFLDGDHHNVYQLSVGLAVRVDS